MAHLTSGSSATASTDTAAVEHPEVQWTAEQQHFMQLAIQQAKEALQDREVPIGCVFVRDGQVIGSGYNMTNHSRNATRHAELEAVDKMLADHGGDASKVQFHRCQLYVTIEPCIMCAGALSLLGIGQVFFGAGNDKFGGCGSIVPVHQQGCGSCTHHDDPQAAAHGAGFPAVGGLFAKEAIQLLQDFYVAGNPAAPKPHRKVMEVPPWQQAQEQQQRQQPMERDA
ncbi:hypothetical protein OEZ85_010295 [Tetradesmus obliquus]|uniref:CMP/dCMP-type deaminase domain-containing protein n=1 Tax=Tetradesmus obliquus TaxID=3088 RepID=A0ABY8TP02_TETOB|nr:hypothetical protein OEZ85_010295 [Tetradesmus obliquus]